MQKWAALYWMKVICALLSFPSNYDICQS